MVMGFVRKTGERIVEKGKKAAEGDVGAIGETLANVATVGQASATMEGAEQLGKAAENFNKVDVAQTKSDYVPYTEDQKNQMREGFSGVESAINKNFNPENLIKAAPGTQALGQEYLSNVKQVNLADLPPLAKTVIQAPGQRQTTQVDMSNVRQAPTVDTSNIKDVSYNAGAVDTSGIAFDPNKVRQGQAYQGAANEQQQFLLQALRQQAEGKGPSVAEQQFKAANEANLAASMAQQASLRGGFDPAAARQIRQTAADLQAKAAQDAAQAKIQEQLAAQQQLASVAATTEQQKATAGAQSLEQQQTDVQTQQTQANVAATKAGIDKGIQDQIANVAAGNSDRALQLQKLITDVESEARAQDIDVAKVNANLEDKAVSEQFEAEVRTNIQNGVLQSEEAKLVFSTNAKVLIENMMAKNDALARAYNGNMQAFMQDVSAANQMIMEAAFKNISIAEAKRQLEIAFIEDGVSAEEAKIRAENGMAAAATAASNATRQMQKALVMKGVDTVAQGGAAFFTGGGSVLAQGAAGLASKAINSNNTGQPVEGTGTMATGAASNSMIA